MAIWAKIENGVLACRDDSLDGFNQQRAVDDGFTAHNVPDAGWLQIQGGVIVEVDPTASRLAEKQAAKWEEIKTYRDKVKAGGVLVSTKWFHTDDASRIQQLGLVQLGANIPAGIMWKTLDGTFIEMTQQLASDIFAAVTTLDITAFANAETHRIAMEASQAPDTYDYSTGWPTTYLYG